MSELPTVTPDAWFTRTPAAAEPAIVGVSEPFVDELLRANFWHVRGRDRDLVVDSGLGVVSLRTCMPQLFERDPLLVLTHAHLDHMGGAHEFTECWAHPLEAVEDPWPGSLDGAVVARSLGIAGPLPESLLTARPAPGYRLQDYRVRPARVTRALRDGDLIDLGDRSFRVIHTPGHSPGGICLFDERRGTLFSGDTVYDDELLDDIVDADRVAYADSLERLGRLDVGTVHPGHGPSFDSHRLHELVTTYLDTGART